MHIHVRGSLQVAEAGFYYCGTAQTPDWVRCVVCHQDMEGWEPEDNPRSGIPFECLLDEKYCTLQLQVECMCL